MIVTQDDETIDQILSSVESICKKYPEKYWLELDKAQSYPTEFVKSMTESGHLNALIPTKYGGAGLSLLIAARILEKIHQSGCNAAAAHAQMYTMGSILKYGSEAQKSKWLPLIAKGEVRLQAFGVSEPEAGTDTSSISTTAIRKENKYILNGQKIWTSRALHSDLMILLAKTKSKNERNSKSDGLSLFLIDIRESLGSGMTIRPIETMINHSTTEVFFDNLEISHDSLIGKENDGFKQVLNSMNAERILIAAECIGDSNWFIQKAVGYAKDRKVFNKRIGENQGIQFPISRCYAETEAAKLAVYNAATLYDSGRACGTEANIAKLLAADASWNSANVCLQTHGGFGFAKEYHIERKFRETRLYQVAPISTNFILSHIAEHKLGLPRSF